MGACLGCDRGSRDDDEIRVDILGVRLIYVPCTVYFAYMLVH